MLAKIMDLSETGALVYLLGDGDFPRVKAQQAALPFIIKVRSSKFPP